MLRGLLTRTLLTAALLTAPAIAHAQYIYLDTNGDGVHSAADQLNASGATSLDIWLNTNHDRDGSLQSCNSHTGSTTGTPLDMFSYTIVLRTFGGTVSWGAFSPADPSYTGDGSDLADTHDTEFTRSRPPSTVTPPGLVKLGTIAVTVSSGAPSVAFGTSTPLDPFGFGTGFGTDCEGSAFANTYVLGTPGDANADWFDTDGAAAPTTGNHSPVLSAPASVTAAAGTLTTINATATDADASDVLSITETGAPASLAFSSSPSTSPATASLSGTPAFGEAAGSPYTIHWTADDGVGGNTSATTSLTITRTDTPPSVAAPDTALFSETFPADFAVSVTDAEGDDVTSLTSSALPAGATFTLSAFNAAGHFEWTPASGQAGSYPVTFTATSGAPSLSGSATTVVKVGPPDHRPVVTLTPTTYTINEGQHIHLTPTASDPDGDPFISFTCKGTQNAPLPPGVTFVTSPDFRSGTFDWTPDFTQSAVYHFDLEATSVGSLGEQISAGLNGGGITVVLVINVRNTDRAPVVTAPATASGTEGVALSVPVSAADPDGDAISSFTASALPAGALFTPASGNTSGTLSWTPSFSQEGSYAVTFTASNLLTGSATTMITIAHANAPPALSAPTSQSVNEGSPLSFPVSAADGDGDHVTLSAPSRPVGAGFTDHGDNTGTFDWTPGFSQAGTYTVTFAGNDGHGGVATATTAITVSNVNRAPLANPGGPYSGLTSVPVSFNGSGSSDPDGDALTYMWSFGDGGTGTGAMSDHVYSAAGAYAVDLTVTDSGTPALSNTASTTATIAAFFTARAFTVTGGNSTIKLGSGKPTWCAQVEPIAGNFTLSDVNLGSILLHYNGSSVPVSASKSTVDVDRDGNGVAEITACFAKGDLRTLFASLPGGHSHVTVTITAGLVTGGGISASLDVDVQKSGNGSAVEVAVSPNPLNPIATLTFSMARPGSAQVGLYNLSGRLVRTLLPLSFLGAGYHDLTIDGRSDHGEKLPSGVYFYDVRTAEGSAQGRVTILK